MSVNIHDVGGFLAAEIPDPILPTNTALTRPTGPGITSRRKVPPVFLRRIDNFVSTCQLLDRLNINFDRAKPSSNAVKLHPPTVEDHLKIKNLFSKLKIPYHTYKLPDDCKLTVMLRGVSCKLSTEEVIVDLANKGLPVREVYRLRKGSDKIPVPIVKVILDKTEEGKDIFSLKEICSKSVHVEFPNEQRGLWQCHRCQKFGHVERRCSATVRCVKCAEEHWTHECRKSRDVPPKCANCSGTHTANYSGCVRRPTLRFTPMDRISSLSDKMSAIKWDLIDDNVTDRWTNVLVKTMTRSRRAKICPEYVFKKMEKNNTNEMESLQVSLKRLDTRLSNVGRPAKIKPAVLSVSDFLQEIESFKKAHIQLEVKELQTVFDQISVDSKKICKKKKNRSCGSKHVKGRRNKKRR